MLKRFGVLLIGYTMVVGFYVLGMTKGWGLTPVSWPWIVGAGVLGPVFIRAFADAWVETRPKIAVEEIEGPDEHGDES